MKDTICDEHHTVFAPRVHPEGMRKGGESMPDNSKRGVGHPAHHTKGHLPSQLNPDHGSHKGAGKHM